jgi:hypothetical protein
MKSERRKRPGTYIELPGLNFFLSQVFGVLHAACRLHWTALWYTFGINSALNKISVRCCDKVLGVVEERFRSGAGENLISDLRIGGGQA